MREIRQIVVHCTGTRPSATVEAIQRYWREELGWRNPGYHIIIRADGTFRRLAPDEAITNGARGHNATSLHICYIGGQNSQNRPADTRTPAQTETLLILLRSWLWRYPGVPIVGHSDLPGVAKACPCFDARAEYAHLQAYA